MYSLPIGGIVGESAFIRGFPLKLFLSSLFFVGKFLLPVHLINRLEDLVSEMEVWTKFEAFSQGLRCTHVLEESRKFENAFHLTYETCQTVILENLFPFVCSLQKILKREWVLPANLHKLLGINR